MNEDTLIENRSKAITSFFKKNYNWVIYLLLAIVVFIAVRIRTLPIPGLRDISTGGWTLGPDLDPFLFLRWAKYILENGSLMSVDMMRYVPLGFNTRAELILHPYLIAWFHKIAVIFGSSSVEQSAAIFPVFMFALTVIAFFLFVREIFKKSLGTKKAGLIAVISSFFLSIIPIFLPRTIAGIPEKEASAFFFMFLAFYFFLLSWNSTSKKSLYIFSILAGLTTAAMALVWGGFVYLFVVLGATFALAFLMGQVDRKKVISYAGWLISATILMMFFSTRYSVGDMVNSTTTGLAYGALLIVGIDYLIKRYKIQDKIKNKNVSNLPPEVFTLILSIIAFAILATLVFGLDFIPSKISSVYGNLVVPVTDRLGVTVAENRQPFFSEWAGSFGPEIGNLPITFLIFMIGSIYLFNFILREFNKKERLALVLAYTLVLFTTVFSRFSSNSILNGTNFISLIVYFLGFAVFGFVAFKAYSRHFKGDSNIFRNIEFGVLLLFVLFFLSVISARGAVRLIMMLVPPVSIIISFFIVDVSDRAIKSKSESRNYWAAGAIILIVLSSYSALQFYNVSYYTGKSYVPSPYTQQWQLAMSFVRDNTSQDAVFGHWWDYGYWVQSIGERATVLDGGNAISYWNHLMGRHALTGTSNQEALEFLYSHNTTHFLIDSTDIGKYPAFSSIGSDENYDRASFIPTLVRDNSQVKETKNGRIYLFQGSFGTDSDIIYEQNGSRIFLPSGMTALAGIIVELDASGKVLSNPEAIYVYQKEQYRVPLRYAFDTEFRDFGTGLESGVYLYPYVSSSSSIMDNGALMYLSDRTVKSQLARLYLYKEANPNFVLVHSEDDFVVRQIKTQTELTKDFVYYQGVRGPIRIWEINYPQNMQVNPDYLLKNFPDNNLAISR